MPGYKNPVIRIPFPEDLADDCHVVIRNPRLMPASEIQSLAGGRTDADRERIKAARAALDSGQEIPDDLVTEEDGNRTYALIARLIIGWRVPDPRVPILLDDDGNFVEVDTPLVFLPPAPVTPELAGLLPQEVLLAIMDEVGKANPQKPPASQADGTSRTS